MRSLERTAAFAAVAYAFVAVMLGTTLPTPLYPLYQKSLGFGEIMVTVVFALYAVGVLAALYLGGGLSDHIGRRRVLLPGVVFSALSAVCFLFQGGLPALFVGRIFSGLSAGLFTGTATATLLDLVPEERRLRGTLVATVVNMGGLGLGPLVSGVVSTAFGAPLRAVFAVDLFLLIPAVVGLLMVPETVEDAGRRLKLEPVALALPEQVRAVFVPASMAGFAGFVVMGLFTAVGPAALGQILGVTNRAAVGAAVFGVFACSTAGQVASAKVDPWVALPAGCGVLSIGLVLLIAGLQVPSLAAVIIGGMLSGAGQGLSFRAAMAVVNAETPPAQRGAITSVFFFVLYIGISIPVVAVGVGAQLSSVKSAGTVCAVAVALMVIVAGTHLRLLRRRQTVASRRR